MDNVTQLPIVGMVGGGQLSRMTHQAAIALGQSLRVLAESPSDAAATVAPYTQIGSHADLEALREFAAGCDVLTFDHEHVPNAHIQALQDAGVTVRPGASALAAAQNKRIMRERLGDLGIPIPRWAPVATGADVRAFAEQVGWPVVIKAATGGYDGRGVWIVDPDDELPIPDRQATDLQNAVEFLVEEKVPLRRELAAVVARSPYGQVAAYPVVETVQNDGICVEVLAPAPGLDPGQAIEAEKLAMRIADALDVVGVLAVELFDTDAGLLVNELAMRPHNSAHWTIDGAVTSQFEQHLRAVLDYPLGATTLLAPAVCMANVLGGEPGGMSLDERLHHLFAADPGAKVQMYGKESRIGRKIGHVTVCGDQMAEVRTRAQRAARWLSEGR